MLTTGQHVDRMRVRLQLARVCEQIHDFRITEATTTEEILDLYGEHARLADRLQELIL